MKKRVYSLDFVRCIALLSLPLIHIVEYWGYICGGADIITREAAIFFEPAYRFFDVFAAPVFLLCMGFNWILSSNQTPEKVMLRGIRLLVLEFVLNCLRYALPALIGVLFGGPGIYHDETLALMRFGMLNSDVLAFAGLVFILFGLLKKLNVNPIGIFLIAFGSNIACELIYRFCSAFISSHASGQLCNLLGNFIYLDSDSTFPLLAWMLLPASGYLIGGWILNHRKWLKAAFFSAAALTCMIMSCLAMGNSPLAEFSLSRNGHHMSPMDSIAIIAIAFLLIALTGFVFEKTGAENNVRFCGIIKKISANLSSFYCLQWIIVGWGLFLPGGLHLWHAQAIGITATGFAILAVTLVSVALAGRLNLPALTDRLFQVKKSGVCGLVSHRI